MEFSHCSDLLGKGRTHTKACVHRLDLEGRAKKLRLAAAAEEASGPSGVAGKLSIDSKTFHSVEKIYHVHIFILQ